ncbi:helix-turn-helix transcriptional regulator [Streptomonospora sp. S1-112]|uniref:Helix-turn-helix transcriptional regulator n=1 Tax=Streptomonospora mangrovi TaxID=2883123 RepID=A0A9X3NK69_9ACTN|nr:helix-turn-helix transcriptional regulator [Streptomonospora mangrovi]MDA0564803.1 helix-turn-helix transcriptional regulator [Streptomonospora mangrovi]
MPTRIRKLRTGRGWSQEELAEAAGLSVTTIKKAEADPPRGEVTTGTLHAIATALGVDTVALYVDRAPRPHLEAEPDYQAMARMRSAIAPPLKIDGTPIIEAADDGEIDLPAIRRGIDRVQAMYGANRYDDVALDLPPLIHQAHRAVAELDSDEAYRTRSYAMQMAGRYLTQVRQISDALTALRASIQDAATAGDRFAAACAISGQGWALTRQGRLDEAERLCTLTADELEPQSIRKASPAELAAWGHLLFRGAAAAVRNNGHDRADELMRVADSAAAALGKETPCWATFGPLTVAHKRIEFSLLKGKPDHTLRMSERLPDVAQVGQVTPINWERHRLDVARALVLTRDPEQSTHVLTGIKDRAPEWLRRQRSAYDTVTAILESRPRRPTEEMVALASHLGISA